MSTNPLRLTVSPAKVITHSLHGNLRVTVSDSGSAALNISTSTREIGRVSGQCVPVSGKAASWASVSPASFRLAPGQSRTVIVRLHAPHSARGTTDVAAMMTGSVAGKSGQVRLSGSVGAQIVVIRPGGKDATHGCSGVSAHHAVPHAAVMPPGASWGSLGAGLACGAALLAAVALLLLRRVIRHRGSRHQSRVRNPRHAVSSDRLDGLVAEYAQPPLPRRRSNGATYADPR